MKLRKKNNYSDFEKIIKYGLKCYYEEYLNNYDLMIFFYPVQKCEFKIFFI